MGSWSFKKKKVFIEETKLNFYPQSFFFSFSFFFLKGQHFCKTSLATTILEGWRGTKSNQTHKEPFRK